MGISSSAITFFSAKSLAFWISSCNNIGCTPILNLYLELLNARIPLRLYLPVFYSSALLVIWDI